MKKTLLTLIILLTQSFVLFSSSQNYFLDGNNRIELRTVTNQKYILYNDAQTVTPLLQNARQVRAGRNGNASRKIRKNDFQTTKWTVVESSEMQLSNIVLNENILYSAPVYIFPDGSEVPISQYFYVKLRNETDENILRTVANENGVEVVVQNDYMPLWYLMSCSKHSSGNALDMSNLFNATGLFEYSYPDFMFEYTLNCANDEYFFAQWNLNNNNSQEYDINLCKAWEITKGSPDIIVAVIDNGVDTLHPDLKNRIFRYSGDDTVNVYAPAFHGTNTAGIIVAESNDTNGIGISGIAPKCKIMPITINMGGYNLMDWESADAINFAWQNGAHIINNSWGIRIRSAPNLLQLGAIDKALDSGRGGLGCVVIFASGNYMTNSNDPNIRDSSIMSPHRFASSDVLVVGGIERDGIRGHGSCFGTQLDVMAPRGVPTTDFGGGYTMNYSGTSSAAPHVAGVAALMLSVNPNLTQQQVGQIIEQTARQIRPDIYDYDYSNPNRPNGGWHEQMGYGLIDACAAVAMAAGTTCSKKITKYYVENICRSNNNYSNVILKPDDIANFNDTEAKWYLGSLDDANIITGNNGKGTFDLAEYLNNNPTANNTNVYLKLSDGTIYQWTTQIVEVEETLAEHYRNSPQYDIIVSPDGKSGSIFIDEITNHFIDMSLQCPYTLDAFNYNLSNISFEFGDSNSFLTFPKLGWSADGKLTISFILNYTQLPCYESITVKTTCKKCIEEFTFHIFNRDSLKPPAISVTKNCDGGVILTAAGGNNCGLDLESRWITPSGDTVGHNSSHLEVSEAGRYRIEYFHPDVPNKVIYSAESEEVEQDDLDEQILTDIVFDSYLSDVLTFNKKPYCHFSLTATVKGNYRNHTFKLYMRTEGNFDWGTPLEDLIPARDSKNNYYIHTTGKFECEEREYKISIFAPNTGVLVCEQIFSTDCGCNTCDGLKKQFTVKKDEEYWGYTETVYEVIFGSQHQYAADRSYCLYEIRIPAGAEIVDIKSNDRELEHDFNSYLFPEGENIYFRYETKNPCPENWIRDTFKITYLDSEGDTCEYSRLFFCHCGDAPPKNDDWHITVIRPEPPLRPEYRLSYCKGSLSPPIPPEDEDLDFWLYDNFGNRIQLLHTLQAGSIPCGDFDFTMSNNYPNGIYHITLENNKGQMLGNEKFVFAK